MNKLEQKRIERKKIIIREAKKLILERGISDGLMSELAVRSGISRQRLYVYYENIDDVLYDIMESVYEHSHFDHLQTMNCAAPDMVIRYSILMFPKISEEAHDDLLFLSLYGVYLATNKKEGVKRNTRRIILFEKQIREGQEQGLFRADHPLEYLSAVVTNMLTGFLYHSETLPAEGRNTMLAEEVLGCLADMVLGYLNNK